MNTSTPAPDSLFSEHILVALRRIIRAIDLHSRSLMRDFGLTGPQLVVLREADARTEVSGSALARAVSVSLATLSGIVTRLEARGLLERNRSSRDKRQVLISVTDKGRRILASAPSPLQDRFTRRLAGLEKWEQTQVLSVLQRIVAMMEAEELDASPILTTGGITEAALATDTTAS